MDAEVLQELSVREVKMGELFLLGLCIELMLIGLCIMGAIVWAIETLWDWTDSKRRRR